MDQGFFKVVLQAFTKMGARPKGRAVGASVAVLLSVSLSSASVVEFGGAASLVQDAGRERIRLMHYNVANLFDTQHDPGKNDWEFTPRNLPGKKQNCMKLDEPYVAKCLDSDWTPARLNLKLQQIKSVVAKSYPMPNLLSVVEIENSNVAEQLAGVLGYRSYQMTDSPDGRGIDVALFYNESASLRYLSHQARRVDLSQVGGRPSRDLLAVEFLVGSGKSARKLAVIVNHWPSQANSTATRMAFAHAVADWSQAYMNQGYEVIVTGDFNVVPENDGLNPFAVLQSGPKGHLVLREVDEMVRSAASEYLLDASYLPPGTYFYANFREPSKSKWNVLDRFFVSNGLMNHLDMGSYRIVNAAEFTTSVTVGGWQVDGVPKHYNHHADSPRDAGYSDHFAIWMDLVL